MDGLALLAIAPVLFVLLLVLYAEMVNGWTDAPNAIVTVVSTGVLPTRVAVMIAVIFNMIGAASGTAVAATIGKGIVDSSAITLPAIAAAMASIIAWGHFAAHKGLPVSKSHALVAGLTGAGLATAGPDALIWSGWQLVLIGLAFSSFIGLTLGWIVGKVVTLFAVQLSKREVLRPAQMKTLFDRLQMCSATAMAWNHGLNDGQKFIGIFALVLVLGGFSSEFTIPWWSIVICAITMGIGTMFGGWRIIRTVGMRMTKLTSMQGFAAELTASCIIFFVSRFGIPLSTTHTINTSIVGVVAAKDTREVRWNVLGRIVLAWVVTFPICGGLSFAAAKIANWIF